MIGGYGVAAGMARSGIIIKSLIGPALKGINKVPGASSLKQVVVGLLGAAGVIQLVDAVFDGDEESLDAILSFIESGIKEGTILMPVYRVTQRVRCPGVGR